MEILFCLFFCLQAFLSRFETVLCWFTLYKVEPSVSYLSQTVEDHVSHNYTSIYNSAICISHTRMWQFAVTFSPYTFPLMLMFSKDCQYNLIILSNITFFPVSKSFLRILWCSQSDDHPENNLAKLGYIYESKRKEEGWLPTGTYHQNPAVWKRKKNLQNLANLGHFFHEKSFVEVKIILFKSKFCENSPVKETLVSRYPPWLCNFMKTRTVNIWDSLIWCTFKFCNIK